MLNPLRKPEHRTSRGTASLAGIVKDLIDSVRAAIDRINYLGRLTGPPGTTVAHLPAGPIISTPAAAFSMLLGKADAEIAVGDTGTVSIYTGTLGSEMDSGADVEGYARAQVVPAGTWTLLLNFGAGWDAIPLECP